MAPETHSKICLLGNHQKVCPINKRSYNASISARSLWSKMYPIQLVIYRNAGPDIIQEDLLQSEGLEAIQAAANRHSNARSIERSISLGL